MKSFKPASATHYFWNGEADVISVAGYYRDYYFRRVFEAAKIQGKPHPHQFRHVFAIKLLSAVPRIVEEAWNDNPATTWERAKQLLAEGAHVRAYDPEAMQKARTLLPQVDMPASAYDAAKDAEALVIATEWKQFRELDWIRIRDVMARPLVLDARNLLDPREMKALGFEYRSVGRQD